MTAIVWGAVGTRNYEAGVDRGVLYPPAGAAGVAWNGLLSVKESPTGGTPQAFYMDGVKYLQYAIAEDFEASISALGAPPEFGPLDGAVSVYAGLVFAQQPRKTFGFSYRTLVGDDVKGLSKGYKVHLVYNALAKPTNRSHDSLSETADPAEYSWDITTVPPALTGYKPTAHVIINSTQAPAAVLAAIELMLYGSSGVAPRMPQISELMTIFAGGATAGGATSGSGGTSGTSGTSGTTYTDNGDGTFNGSGNISNPDSDSYSIDDSSATDNGDGTFTTS